MMRELDICCKSIGNETQSDRRAFRTEQRSPPSWRPRPAAARSVTVSVGEKLTEAREERERKGGGSFHGRRAPTTGKKRENMERAQRMDGAAGGRAPLQKED